MKQNDPLPPRRDGEAMGAWVAAHLNDPQAIWQAFRDFPEPDAPAEEPAGEDAEAAEAELAALLGYAEQMNARSAFAELDGGFPPPPPLGMDGAFPMPPTPGDFEEPDETE